MNPMKNKMVKKFTLVAGIGLALGLGGCAQEANEEPSAEALASEQSDVLEENDSADEAAQAKEPAAPTVRVSAEELYSAFDSNEAAAQMKYGKSTLIVSGEIKSISLDFSDEPVINLVTSNMFSSVALNDIDNDVAASLSKGQSITAKCTKLTEVIGSPRLGGCSIM
jgi:hypothetical protein